MKIKPFAVEEWMNAWEVGAKYNIAETCVDSVSVDKLFELTGEDKQKFLDAFCARRLTYGDIEGAPAFKEEICKLYKTITPEEIIPTHGATGANHHVFYSMISPGDRVISIMPTYQQLYSIPESYGADVQIVDLYEKGISVSGMSMVFSLAGLCLGWIATHDKEVIKTCLSHWDYNLISGGMFDEALAAVALKHSDKLLERNKGIVRQNLKILDEWVENEPHVSYVKPQAGTTALVYYDLESLQNSP